MKRTVLFTLVMLSLSILIVTAQEDDSLNPIEHGSRWSMRLMNFDVRASRNGYSMSNTFIFQRDSYRWGIYLDYGSFFSKGLESYQMITATGGGYFGYKNWEIGGYYGRNMPYLSYLYYGVQMGVDIRTSYRFSSALTAYSYLFYGQLSPNGIDMDDGIYYILSAYGDIYSDFQHEVIYQLALSQAFDLDQNKNIYSVEGKFLSNLFSNKITAKGTIAYLNRQDGVFLEEYQYDFSTFTPGLSKGVITGDFAAILELTGRFFPLEWVPSVGELSNMFYLSMFTDVGYILPRDKLLKEGLGITTLGVGIGFLFFNTDISFELGWNSSENLVFQFSVMTNALKW